MTTGCVDLVRSILRWTAPSVASRRTGSRLVGEPFYVPVEAGEQGWSISAQASHEDASPQGDAQPRVSRVIDRKDVSLRWTFAPESKAVSASGPRVQRIGDPSHSNRDEKFRIFAIRNDPIAPRSFDLHPDRVPGIPIFGCGRVHGELSARIKPDRDIPRSGQALVEYVVLGNDCSCLRKTTKNQYRNADQLSHRHLLGLKYSA